MSAPEVEALVEALAVVMRDWGVRSKHGEWSDAEVQRSAAINAYRAVAEPLMALGGERLAEVEAERDRYAAWEEHAAKLAASRLIRAERAEADAAALRERVEALAVEWDTDQLNTVIDKEAAAECLRDAVRRTGKGAETRFEGSGNYARAEGAPGATDGEIGPQIGGNG